MRLDMSVALAVAFVAAGHARAEDVPEGSIGLRVELKDGRIVVVEAVRGGPAEKAGIKTGDVIVKAKTFQVKDAAEQFELQRVVEEILRHKPGEKVKLVIRRDGKDMTIEVTIGKRSEIFPKDKD